MITKKGTVAKISGDKTIKVEVIEYQPHPKYKKMYPTNAYFLAHDEKGVAKVGDKVVIQQCRPISRKKHWKLTETVTSASST